MARSAFQARKQGQNRVRQFSKCRARRSLLIRQIQGQKTVDFFAQPGNFTHAPSRSKARRRPTTPTPPPPTQTSIRCRPRQSAQAAAPQWRPPAAHQRPAFAWMTSSGTCGTANPTTLPHRPRPAFQSDGGEQIGDGRIALTQLYYVFVGQACADRQIGWSAPLTGLAAGRFRGPRTPPAGWASGHASDRARALPA